MPNTDPYAALAEQMGVTGAPAATAAPAPSPAPAPAPVAGAPAPAADPYAAIASQMGVGAQPQPPKPDTSLLDRAENVVTAPGTLLPMLNPVGAVKGYAEALKNPVAFAKAIPGLFDEETSMPLVKFEGAMTPEEQEKHPLLTGVLERLSGMTDQKNAAMIVASDGLGALPGASGKIVPRLIAGGFSAAQVSSLIKEVPAFREAIANGDQAGAEKIAGHFAVDLTAALMGGQHSIVGEGAKPLFPGMDEAVKDFVAQGASKLGVTADIAKQTLAGGAEKAKNVAAAAKAAVSTEDATPLANLKKVLKPSVSHPFDDADLEVAANALHEHHNTVEPVRDVTDVPKALTQSISENDAKVRGAIKLIADEPIGVDIKSAVRDELAKSPRKDAVQRGLAALDEYKNIDDPTFGQADGLRLQLNHEMQGILDENGYDKFTALKKNPEYAALDKALSTLRDGLYDGMEEHGIDGAREMRQVEGSLSRVRDAAQAQEFNGESTVRGTGPKSLGRTLGRGTTKMAGTLAGTGAGYVAGGPIGAGVAGAAGSEIAGRIGEKLFPTNDLTRNELLGKFLNDYKPTERPSEAQVTGQIKRPTPKPSKGQQDIPFGSPELFGENQGDRAMSDSRSAGAGRTAMELHDSELSQINKVVQDINKVRNDPNATAIEKMEANRRLRLIFGAERGTPGKTPEMIAAPTLLTPNEPHSLGAGAALEVPEAEDTQTVPHVPGMNVPPARTTGQFDSAIQEGGAVPAGIQKGDPEINLDNLVLFHDPATGSTLALPENQMTAENVRDQMRKSRQAYLKARPDLYQEVAPGHPLHIPDDDIQIVSHTGRNNGSGESVASQEAINRVAAEKHAGIVRMRRDTRSGRLFPLTTVDAVDAKAGPYDEIVKLYPNGHEEILDQGAKARPSPKA